MTEPTEPPDKLTPAEAALEAHLELLRGEYAAPPASMDRQVLARARWQRSIRRPLITIGHFAETVRDGLRLLLMPPPR